MQGNLHQMHQAVDMVQVGGPISKLMVTGSDDSVTQCATLKTRSTLYINLKQDMNLFKSKGIDTCTHERTQYV